MDDITMETQVLKSTSRIVRSHLLGWALALSQGDQEACLQSLPIYVADMCHILR
jgi:hypothetical protein